MVFWRTARVLTLMLVLGRLLVACGGSGDGITAGAVWARESPATAQNGAFYLRLENHGGSDDALIGVQSEACGRMELHESSMDDRDVMSMAHVEGGRIPLPTGESVLLEPGGLHIMCLDIAQPFVLGERIPLVLTFEQHAPLQVEAEIRRDTP